MGRIIKLTRQQLREAAPYISNALITEEWTKFSSISEITKRLSENPSVDDWFGLIQSDIIKSKAKKHEAEDCTIYDLTDRGISKKLIKTIEKLNKALKLCSSEFVVSDEDDDVNDYHMRFVFTALYAGKNGTGNSAMTDTRQVEYMAKRAKSLGIDMRISDASFDMCDDVSTWLAVLAFDFDDKPHKY